MSKFGEEVSFGLRILRGRGLVAQDVMPGLRPKSDPYCKVFVGAEEVGATSAVSGTLDPVFSPTDARFEIKCPAATRVRIEIWDWDLTQEDDPMGQVTFYVADVMAERRAGAKKPNAWYPVVSLDGSPFGGHLEVSVVFADEAPSGAGPRPPDLDGARDLAAGPSVSVSTFSGPSLRDLVSRAATPVFLNVYHVGHSNAIRAVNACVPVGGVYHGGLQVFDKEYSFGGCRARKCGIFACNPRKCPMHAYKETVYLGDCGLARPAVAALLRDMRPHWMGPSYDLLRKNCVFFCREFAAQLGLGPVPSYIYRLANIGAGLQDALSSSTTAHQPDLDAALQRAVQDNGVDDLNSLLLEHVMAVRLQTGFRARRSRRHSHHHHLSASS